MPLLLAVLALLLLPGTAAAQAQEATITSSDGTTLAADVHLPPGLPGGGRVPVVLDAGPYFGRPQEVGVDPALKALPGDGIAVVNLSLRGFGGSGGCVDFHGPADRRDLRAAVEWAAAQPWSTGRVAVAGFSYDGGAAVDALAAAGDLLDAAVLIAPQADGYAAIYHQRVRLLQPVTLNAIGPGLSAFDAAGPATGGSADREVTNAHSADPACWAAFTQGTEQRDPEHPFWRARRPAAEAAGTRVPVLLSYGFEDTTTPLSDLLAALGGPVRAWLGQWDHDEPSGRDGFRGELRAFLAHHLERKGAPPPPGAVVQTGSGAWRSEAAWPPQAREELALPVLPGSFRDAPGNTADGRLAVLSPGAPVVPGARQGEGSWTFTPPLTAERHLAGEPRLALETPAAGGQVVALLYDLAPDGTATLVSRGAATLPVAGHVRLAAQDWRFAPGHRIGLLLSGADDSTYRPGTSGGDVRVLGGTLRLPVLRAVRRDDLDGGPGRWFAARQPFVVDPAVVASRTPPGRR